MTPAPTPRPVVAPPAALLAQLESAIRHNTPVHRDFLIRLRDALRGRSRPG